MKRLFTLLLFGLTIFALQAQDANGRWYSAGEIQSRREVQYGRFEMLMYSSDMSGTTSTFFMWKQGGQEAGSRWNEIDIETFGKNGTQWQSNPIWEYNDSDTDIKRWEEYHDGVQIANAWVKFTLEWTPDYIAWFNNDIEVRRIVKGENVPESHWGSGNDPVGHIGDAMRMSFNHWATFPGDWLGPFDPADLPSYQFVDWFTYQPWNGTGFDGVEFRMDFDNLQEVQDEFYISTHTFGDNQCTFTANNIGVTDGYLWLSITGYQDARPPMGTEIPAGNDPVIIVHDVPGLIEAEEYAKQNGFQLEDVDPNEGDGQNLGFANDGDYAEYQVNVSQSGPYDVKFRVASLNGSAGFDVLVDGEIQIEGLVIPATQGWQAWETVTEVLNLEAGEHTIRINAVDEGFNLNWMELTENDDILNANEAHMIREGIYPNPAKNVLVLPVQTSWVLMNAYGVQMKNGFGEKVNLANYLSGPYMIQTDYGSFAFIKE